MATRKQCFIIMPITTPALYHDKYRDGAEHFKHVLEHLLVPSVDKANYEPLKPIAKGADLIHAEIVNQLETADIVLCDMSTLNANVFFELGIRCALNKPVCIVKDELTDRIPFDTSILNHHEYKSALDPWTMDADISTIAKHIEESFTRSKGTNTLWRYFGARSTATPAARESGSDDKFDMLFSMMDGLRQKLEDGHSVSIETPEPVAARSKGKALMEAMDCWLKENMRGVAPMTKYIGLTLNDPSKSVTLFYSGIIGKTAIAHLRTNFALTFNRDLLFQHLPIVTQPSPPPPTP